MLFHKMEMSTLHVPISFHILTDLEQRLSRVVFFSWMAWSRIDVFY
jgi:hypothetical protein